MLTKTNSAKHQQKGSINKQHDQHQARNSVG